MPFVLAKLNAHFSGLSYGILSFLQFQVVFEKSANNWQNFPPKNGGAETKFAQCISSPLKMQEVIKQTSPSR